MLRLRNRAQFQAVLAGPPVAKTAHFALHRGALDGAHDGRPLFATADVWLGVMLPKRWARRAVTRNTIRRQIYEVARALPGDLPQAAWVVRLRSEFSRKVFISATSDPLRQAVRAELQQLLGKVMRKAPAPEAGHVV